MATEAKKENVTDDVVDPLDDESQDFADELKPGTKLLQGQYTIERFLNSGGFGITYLAKDSLDRLVVIKECFPGSFCRRSNTIVGARSRAHQNEFKSIVRLFVQEAKSLSKLNHPNIVGVHQVFEDNDTAYMAIDYIEGRDLLEIIEDDKEELATDRIVSMLEKVLKAVDFIHDSGVLHRDISPDNILMTGEGEPVLIDFGAAREQATKASRALSALRVVKDGYSPQEFYIAGSVQSNSSDLYALAATFHHVIAGDTPPNSQARLAAIAADDDDPYQPLAGRFEGYPPGFLEAIDKALNVLPKDRIQNAHEWLAEIDEKARIEAAKKAAENDEHTDAVVAELVAKQQTTGGAAADGDEKDAAKSAKGKVTPTKPQRVAKKDTKPVKKLTLKEPSGVADAENKDKSSADSRNLDAVRVQVEHADGEEKKGKGLVVLLGSVAAIALIVGASFMIGGGEDTPDAGTGTNGQIVAPTSDTENASGSESTQPSAGDTEQASVTVDESQRPESRPTEGSGETGTAGESSNAEQSNVAGAETDILSDPVALSKALAELEAQKDAARRAEEAKAQAEAEAKAAADAAAQAKAEAEAKAAAEAQAKAEAERKAAEEARAQAEAERKAAEEERAKAEALAAKEAQARQEAEARAAAEAEAREKAEEEAAAAALARREAEELAAAEAKAKAEAEEKAKAADEAQAAAEAKAAEQARIAAEAKAAQQAQLESDALAAEEAAGQDELASLSNTSSSSKYLLEAGWSFSLPFTANSVIERGEEVLFVSDVAVDTVSSSNDDNIEAGDIIQAVNGTPVKNTADLQKILLDASGIETVGGVIAELDVLKGTDGSVIKHSVAIPAQRIVVTNSGITFEVRLTGDGWQPFVVEAGGDSVNGLQVGDIVISNFATQQRLETPDGLEELFADLEESNRSFVDLAVTRDGELTLAIMLLK